MDNVNKENILKILKAGDLLAYKPSSLLGWGIAIKTWHKISHTEIYIASEKTASSRAGKGVRIFDLEVDNLEGIYRPNKELNLMDALDWFHEKAESQGYDYIGFFVFWLAKKHGNNGKMFCSEFCTRFYRRGGLDPFTSPEDADKIAPFQLTITPVFDKIL